MARFLPTLSFFALSLSGCDLLIVDDELYQDMVKPYEDGDKDGFTPEDGDCDDEKPTIHPGAEELCDDLDNDCDGDIDEEGAADSSTWYADFDGDGFGDATSSVQACTAPSSHIADNTDCDDTNPEVHPSAEESCNSIDDDCDGTSDEADATDAGTWYADTDNDGFGDASSGIQACTEPSGHVADNTDCNDAATNAHPGGTEACDSLDNDCDGAIDEDDATDASTWYADTDNDGFGDASSSLTACTAPSGHVADNTDCNDGAANAHPGGTEVCDTLDNDCDGTPDEDDATDANTWYADTDNDGFGDANSGVPACTAPSGLIADNTDCNDSESTIHPSATEVCDAADTDEDCNGLADNDDSGAQGASTFYVDSDGDGYGHATSTQDSCDIQTGLSNTNDDCNDTDAAINPGAGEYCSTVGVDDDCDGEIDEDSAVDGTTYYTDSDGDGYGPDSTMVTTCGSTSTGPSTSSGTSSPGLAITDYNTTTDSITTTVDCGTVYELTVDVDITHEYRGDMTIDLYGPSGNDIALWSRGGYSSMVDLVATFTDSGVSNDNGSSPLGNILPYEPLSGFTGEASAGTWTLEITDNLGSDEGILNSWGVNIQCAATVQVADGGDCDDSDAATYPGAAAQDSTTACMTDGDGDGWGDTAPATDVNAGTDCDDTDASINPGATDAFGDGVDNDCDGTTDSLTFIDLNTGAWQPNNVYGPRLAARSDAFYLAWSSDQFVTTSTATTKYDGQVISTFSPTDPLAGSTTELSYAYPSDIGDLGEDFDFTADDTYLYVAGSYVPTGTSNRTLFVDTIHRSTNVAGGTTSTLISGSQPYEDVKLFLLENNTYDGYDYLSAVGCGADGVETIIGRSLILNNGTTAYSSKKTSAATTCAPTLIPYLGGGGYPNFYAYYSAYNTSASYGKEWYYDDYYSNLQSNWEGTCYYDCADTTDIQNWQNNGYRITVHANNSGGTLEAERRADTAYYADTPYYHYVTVADNLQTLSSDVSTSGTVYVCGVAQSGVYLYTIEVDYWGGGSSTETQLIPTTGTLEECDISINDADMMTVAIRSGTDIYLGTAQLP